MEKGKNEGLKKKWKRKKSEMWKCNEKKGWKKEIVRSYKEKLSVKILQFNSWNATILKSRNSKQKMGKFLWILKRVKQRCSRFSWILKINWIEIQKDWSDQKTMQHCDK